MPRRSSHSASSGGAGSTADEQRLFEQEMKGVRRLPDTPHRHRALLEPDVGTARAPARPPPEGRPDVALAVEEAGEVCSGLAPGVSRKTLKRLRAGDPPVQAKLDLHGMTRQEASAALDRFVARASAEGVRCLMVVHGRGLNSGAEGPVLRRLTRDLFCAGKARRDVLAFTSAPPSHGGGGALIVLLRGAGRNRR